jgi:hypothetical protein
VYNEGINIKCASETLLPFIEKIKANGNEIILKMDCEGSEYDIFESLSSAKILPDFNFIIVEWHYKDPEKIFTALRDAGFVFMAFDPQSKTAGMIYAFRQN